MSIECARKYLKPNESSRRSDRILKMLQLISCYQMLSERQVVAIYMAKLALRVQSREDDPDTNFAQKVKGQSSRFAAMYRVTSRAIRDIWNRQSWAYATRHLWNLESQISEGSMISTPAVKVLLLLFMSRTPCTLKCWDDAFLLTGWFTFCVSIYIGRLSASRTAHGISGQGSAKETC